MQDRAWNESRKRLGMRHRKQAVLLAPYEECRHSHAVQPLAERRIEPARAPDETRCRLPIAEDPLDGSGVAHTGGGIGRERRVRIEPAQRFFGGPEKVV